MAFTFSGTSLTLQNLEDILQKHLLLEIPAIDSAAPSAVEVTINADQAVIAQDYLAVHAVGFGAEVPEEIIRLAFIIHLQILINRSQPGIQPATLNRLVSFFNRDIFPVVLQEGTSAAQLAQLILPLAGVGKVKYQGYELNAADILDIFSWEPLTLHPAEVTALLQEQTFPLAQATYHLLQTKKLMPWVAYLAAVFTQISSANPDELEAQVTQLQNAFNKAQTFFERDAQHTDQTQNQQSLASALTDLALQLQSNIVSLANCTAETFENLISTSEPPATSSFAQALALVDLLKPQSDQVQVHAAATSNQLFLLNKTLESFIPLTEQIVALAFWSVSQVGKVFNLAAENLTLATYYHSELFVPKEIVIIQLTKTITFIKTHTPTVQD